MCGWMRRGAVGEGGDAFGGCPWLRLRRGPRMREKNLPAGFAEGEKRNKKVSPAIMHIRVREDLDFHNFSISLISFFLFFFIRIRPYQYCSTPASLNGESNNKNKYSDHSSLITSLVKLRSELPNKMTREKRQRSCLLGSSENASGVFGNS